MFPRPGCKGNANLISMASGKSVWKGVVGMQLLALLLLVAALVAFLFIVRKARCLGWVIGLLCLGGFLWLLSVLR